MPRFWLDEYGLLWYGPALYLGSYCFCLFQGYKYVKDVDDVPIFAADWLWCAEVLENEAACEEIAGDKLQALLKHYMLDAVGEHHRSQT